MNDLIRLDKVAKIDISNVDKKTKENQKGIRLCNFVDVYHNWAITSDLNGSLMVATANDAQIEKYSLKKGQVAITKDSETRDDIGIATYIADEFDDVLLGYHCALITPNEKIVKGKYLNAFINSPTARKHFENQASGSGQRYTLTQDAIGSLKVPIVSGVVQEKIGNFFSFIDRKISNNNKINAELESMAKTIYDYWFLQFEFPNEEGKPYKSSGGKMVWNEELKREIPEGWTCKTIDAITKRVKVGFVGPVDKYYCEKDKGYPIVRPAEMGETGIDYDNLNHITEEFYDKNRKSQVKRGDIIISRCGKDGIPNIYDSDEKAQVLNAVIIENDNLYASSEFIYETLKSPYVQKQITNKTSGSVQGVINTSMIASITIPYQNEAVKLFIEHMEGIYQEVSNNNRQTRELASLRDFLLPLLMNGQVGFKEDN